MPLSENIPPPVSARRIKLVYITPELVISIMSGITSRLPDGRKLRTLESDVPDICNVDNVTYDASRACFAVLVRHKSFPEVPCGEHAGVLRGPTMEITDARSRFLVSARVKIRNWLRRWPFARTTH